MVPEKGCIIAPTAKNNPNSVAATAGEIPFAAVRYVG